MKPGRGQFEKLLSWKDTRLPVSIVFEETYPCFLSGQRLQPWSEGGCGAFHRRALNSRQVEKTRDR